MCPPSLSALYSGPHFIPENHTCLPPRIGFTTTRRGVLLFEGHH